MTIPEAADEIMAILRELPSPRDAARVMAVAHLMLLEAEGVQTEADMLVHMEESSRAVIDGFRGMHGLPTQQ